LNQGQGWQRNIVMNGSPHLPASIRQWFGDSRGHWEGDTLVIDVTNFSPKTDFQGSRENLNLVERWTPSRAATKETMACRGCCMRGAWKSAPLPRGGVPTREPSTTLVACCQFKPIRCCASPDISHYLGTIERFAHRFQRSCCTVAPGDAIRVGDFRGCGGSEEGVPVGLGMMPRW
jgi:hypothetical protein